MGETLLRLTLALDPQDWRAADKATWAGTLVDAVDAAAPHLMQVCSYEIGDTLVYVRLRAWEKPARLRRLLRDDEGFRRLRARLADLGARPDLEIETG